MDIEYCALGLGPCGTAMDWTQLWGGLIAGFGGVFLAFAIGAAHERKKLERTQNEAKARLLAVVEACGLALLVALDEQVTGDSDLGPSKDPIATDNGWRSIISLRAHLEWLEGHPASLTIDQYVALEILRASLEPFGRELEAALQHLNMGNQGYWSLKLRHVGTTIFQPLDLAIKSLKA